MLIDSLHLGKPLDGEVVLITGAGRGIGREAALAVGALGATVAVAELMPGGADTAAAIRARGGAAEFFQVDVADPDAMDVFRRRLIDRFGHVDAVVNNAVVFYARPLLEATLAEWDRVMAVNLRAAFLAAKLFVPDMLSRRHGVFVTMQSGDGMPYMASYFATKVALRSLASSLAQEIGPDSGVSVFCFGAGMVDTPAIREAVPKLAPLYGMTDADFIARSAPGGMLMSAEECGVGLAGCIVHASELHAQEPAAVTGLALLGVGSGEWAGQGATDARAAARALDAIVGGLKAELEGMGMFQRQWYRRTLRQRSGLSLDEWDRLVHTLESNPSDAGRHAAEVDRLAAYFAGLENDARGYIRDPRKLTEAIGALEARRAAAEKVAAALR